MIREYQKTDTEQIIDVWFESSSKAHPFLDASFMEKEKNNIRDIYLPNTETWVFEKQNMVVGFISIMGNEVGAIFIKPEYHGIGIGTELMNFVALLHDELEVEVFEKNTIGRRFYDKYGFKLMREYVHEETKENMLRMKFSR